MELFEFGEYWDTYTYLLILFTGFVICILSKRGAITMTGIKVNAFRGSTEINIWYILLFALFVILYTFKDVSFGADSDFYVKNFQASTEFHNYYNAGLEPLFKLFTYLVRRISNNYTVYFFFAALIVASGYVHFIKTFWHQDCEFLFIILIAVQFFYDMNIMRAGIGGAFILHSFCCLKNNKIGKAIFLTIIGICFQLTFIVNLPFLACYFLLKNRKKLSRTKVLTLFLLVSAATLSASYFSQLIISSTRYAAYSTMMKPTVLGNWNLILSALLALVILSKTTVSDIRLNISIIGSLFSAILIIPVLVLGAYRLPFYFYMLRIFLWGYVFENQKIVKMNPAFRKCLALLLVVFYSLFVISRRSSDYGFAYSFVELFSR